MHIQLPPIILPDVAQPRVPESLLHQLQPNQRVTAIVEAELGDDLYMLRMGNQQTRAHSDKPLQAGSSVQLEVSTVNNATVLKLVSETAGESHATITLKNALCQFMPRMHSLNDWQKTLVKWSGSATPTPSNPGASVLAGLAELSNNALETVPLDQTLASTAPMSGTSTGSMSMPATRSATVAANQLAQQILTTLPSVNTLSQAEQLREVIAHSGLFWDQSLSDAKPGKSTGTASSNVSPADMKGKLLQLAALLQSSLFESIDDTLAQNARSGHSASPEQLASLLQASQNRQLIDNAALQGLGFSGGHPADSSDADGRSKQQARQQRPAEPELDGLSDSEIQSKLEALTRNNLERLPEEQLQKVQETLEMLKKTEGALASIVVDQVASQLSRDGQIWRMDIPYIDPHGKPQTLHLQIKRDGQTATSQSATTPVWRVELSLSPTGLGLLHSHITMAGERIDAIFWSEDAATTRFINSKLPMLQARLSEAGLDVRNLEAVHGRPVDNDIPPPPLSGYALIDERA